MDTLDRDASTLLVIDVQARLMPAIHEGAQLVDRIRRLMEAASLLGVPCQLTEQTPERLGATLPALAGPPAFRKVHFDACREPGFLPLSHTRPLMVVAGCEAHVCVQQTVLGLRQAGRAVAVVADAVGSRAPADRDRALARMDRVGAQLVTLEMVVFEWLGSADHPRFREALRLVK